MDLRDTYESTLSPYDDVDNNTLNDAILRIEPSNDAKIVSADINDCFENIRRELNEQSKFEKLLGGRESLIVWLQDLVRVFANEKNHILVASTTSHLVFGKLKALSDAMLDLHLFLRNSKNLYISLRKKPLKKELLLLRNTISSAQANLISSAGLEILTRQEQLLQKEILDVRRYTESMSKEIENPHEKEKEIINDYTESASEDLAEYSYREGVAWYYGIDQRPKNFNKAYSCFVDASERGHVSAMLLLRLCLKDGLGVKRDARKAKSWLDRAAHNGSAAAKYELASELLAKGRNQSLTASDCETPPKQLIQRAIRLLLQASEQGHAEAQYSLGTVFEDSGDIAEASRWYSKARAAGSVHGANRLGLLHFGGHGMQKDPHKAYTLFCEASMGGCAAAHVNVGLCLELGAGVTQDIQAAIRFYDTGATAGSSAAMYSLGYLLVQQALLTSGSSGVEQGLRWLRRALEAGETEAGYQLGRLYEAGRGMTRDVEAALEHYKRAAELGHNRAALYAAHLQFQSGGRNGHSTEALYRQAAEGGLVEGMNALALMLESHNEPIEAAAWYRAAAESGMADAACNLGQLVLRGALGHVAGAEELTQVQDWLAEAVATGHPKAQLFSQTIDQLRFLQSSQSLAKLYSEKNKFSDWLYA